MRIPDHPTEVRRMLDARRRRLAPGGPALAATLNRVDKRCGKPSCRCVTGEPHVAWRLTYKEAGATRTVHVPVAMLEEVRSWIAEHKRIKALQAEIHRLAVALVRTHVRHKRLKAGRP
jgi:hypothetical protein